MKSSRFLIGLIAVVASFVVGRIAGSDDLSTIMFLCVGGVWLFVTLSSLSKKNELAQVTEKRQQLAAISEKYNLQVKQLADKGNTPDFEQAYERLHTAFDQETGSVLDNEAVKTLRSWRSRYLMVPLLALCALLFNWGGQGREAQIEAEKFAALTATDEWAAETIPMPFLEDSMRYVSNPDKTVSPETENKLNEMLFHLDKGQDIQSAMCATLISTVSHKPWAISMVWGATIVDCSSCWPTATGFSAYTPGVPLGLISPTWSADDWRKNTLCPP